MADTPSTLSRLIVSLLLLLALAVILVTLGWPRSPALLPGPSGAPAAVPFHGTPPKAAFLREAFCLQCHPAPPHRRSAETRSMLNQHTTTLHCLTCHGRPFVDLGRQLVWKQFEGGFRVLTPSDLEGAGGAALEKRWREQALTSGPCFRSGPLCGECHAEKGPLDFNSLGYEAEKSAHLRKLEEFLIASPGKKWFFPELF